MKKTSLLNICKISISIIALILTNKFISYNKPINPEIYSTLNSDFVKIISFGNYRFISGFIWAKTLLDADTEHISQGEKSWLYYRFKLISDLDPTFYENYLHGGVYLSIIKDDIYSAAEIFDKGLSYYPKDFQLLYNAAFNYHFQIRNFDKSLKYYQRIKLLPKEYHFRILPTLIKQAQERVSSRGTYLSVLYEKLDSTKDPKERKAIKQKIKRIKKSQQ
ncbi:hypothetical protein DAY19_05295 [Halobacteriovorax vibrionivorans]|uniref:Tetratricopeptide repeat protein n=1 Tax=Halobacteriovorax vibrionivorans TaxID=2152716 RepID=A0ABY0IJQ1_9BACT|nr:MULTISPECIES: hypothetical protein [Halobacteriovorax]RZF23185.1 hypothetical protein DAY19_05295 [Halobacteriovorax vibrionivorans]TGD46338.1 hypothetical protein EP118_12295 [Halobacteriovorax sp. Y22]